jgi:hypothetical protein
MSGGRKNMIDDPYHHEIIRTYYITPEGLGLIALAISLLIAVPVVFLLRRSARKKG